MSALFCPAKEREAKVMTTVQVEMPKKGNMLWGKVRENCFCSFLRAVAFRGSQKCSAVDRGAAMQCSNRGLYFDIGVTSFR